MILVVNFVLHIYLILEQHLLQLAACIIILFFTKLCMCVCELHIYKRPIIMILNNDNRSPFNKASCKYIIFKVLGNIYIDSNKYILMGVF